MLIFEQKVIVKVIVFVLEVYGEMIICIFYVLMFVVYFELFNIFNFVNQQIGKQVCSLVVLVLVYVVYIDYLEVLGGMVGWIVYKYVSLEVLFEYYFIVGQYLFGVIVGVLGDVVKLEILDVWVVVYGELVDLMIGIEKGMYDVGVGQFGGWCDFWFFWVVCKVVESCVIIFFVFEFVGGGVLFVYQLGQYFSLKVKVLGQEWW